MKNVKKIGALASLLVLLYGTQLSAQAASLGTVSGTTTMYATTTGGSFEDLYTFSVVPNSATVLSTASVSFASYGPVVDSLKVYLGAYTTALDLAGKTALTMTSTSSQSDLGGGVISYSLSAASLQLVAGKTYTMVIDGMSQGASGYSAIVSVSAIPEPQTYGMLLSGLGFMGVVAWRRRKAR